MADFSDLPPEVQEAMRAQQAKWNEDFSAFAKAIADKRDEAVKGRTASGIEETWRECEEAYIGIDDANRHEFKGARWMKPTTMAGGLEQQRAPDATKPTGFVRLTSRYVDAAAAKIGEITIPVDGKSFSLKATPIPEAVRLREDLSQFHIDGVPQWRAPKEGEIPPQQPADGQQDPNAPPAPQPQVPLTVKDLAEKQIELAEKSAKKAETRIYDWQVECQHAAQLRKVEFDMARLGVGVLKGPVPDVRRSNVTSKTPMGVALEIVAKTVPVTRWVDPWNFFPDPACGECIHDGDYCLERDHMTRGRLEALKDTGFYLNDAIDKVLEEGPDKITLEADNPKAQEGRNRNQFEIWYFYGRIRREDLELTNPKEYARVSAEEKSGERQQWSSIHAIVTLVNDTPIRVVLNPLEKSGSFPYHVGAWRRRTGFWAGVGVAEQLRFPQKLINGATRAMMSNAAKSAGSFIAINDSVLVPKDGSWLMTPDKFMGLAPDADVADMRAAIAVFQIPNVTPQLMALVEYALKTAEESTNIPLVTQGQSGATTPDTFGGQQLQDNNANQLLRDVGYGVAEQISNPCATQFYEWLLMDEDVPDDEKGDHQVDANAAISLIEKALQDLAIMQAGAMVANPAFGIDPEKYFQVWARKNRMSPDDLQFSQEERDKRKNQPPPPPPQIEVAKINAQSRENIAKSHDQLQSQRNQNDLDRDTRYNEVLAAREENNREKNLEELRLKVRLAELEAESKRQTSLDDNKVTLATTAMKLNTQRELSAGDRAHDLHKHEHPAPQITEPPTEPAGTAPAGEAFEK